MSARAGYAGAALNCSLQQFANTATFNRKVLAACTKDELLEALFLELRNVERKLGDDYSSPHVIVPVYTSYAAKI